jgi:P pilus assembly chaperone PapD
MSELLPIWDTAQLAAGANNIQPFTIPNNPNAKGLIINNQSKYWILISMSHTGKNVDRIEPFSHLIIPFEPDLTLAIDANAPISTLSPDHQFIDYSTVHTPVSYSKGSTQFSGSSTVDVSSAQISMTATNVTVNNDGMSASLTDASGTIAAANASQHVLVSNPSRKYLLFQNLSANDMYINFASAATTGAGSIWVQANGGALIFESKICPVDALNVICNTSGAGFTCKYI